MTRYAILCVFCLDLWTNKLIWIWIWIWICKEGHPLPLIWKGHFEVTNRNNIHPGAGVVQDLYHGCGIIRWSFESWKWPRVLVGSGGMLPREILKIWCWDTGTCIVGGYFFYFFLLKKFFFLDPQKYLIVFIYFPKHREKYHFFSRGV